MVRQGSIRGVAVGVGTAWIAALSACGVQTSENSRVRIESISPASSSITGGVTVTLVGKGFDDGDEAPEVYFGESLAQVVSVTENTLTVTLPAGMTCGPVNVQVTNGNGSGYREDGFSYIGGDTSLTVTSINPPTGQIGGGTDVTIEGSGFSGGVGVSLGGLPLINIQIQGDTRLTARIPTREAGGRFDLVIRNCASQASLPAAFTYTSGLNGALIDLPLFDYVNPSQFGNPAPQDLIDPFVAFVEPTATALTNPLPPTIDTCRFNAPVQSAPDLAVIALGDQVSLSSGGQSMTIDKQSDDLYYYAATDNSVYATSRFVPGGRYNFGSTGDGETEPFSVTDAFTAPSNYQVSSPDIDNTDPTIVPRSQMQWSWTATTPGDFFEILLIGYSNAGTETNEVLSCYVRDDGNFLIPTNEINKFSGSTTQLVVLSNRRKDSEFLVPANGSKGRAVVSLYKVGYLRF